MLAGGLSVAVGQEPVPSPVQTSPATPDTTKPQQPSSQPTAQPGAGSQVQTGSVLGNAGSQSLLSRLAALLNDHQYPDVEKMLDEADTSDNAGRLTPQQKQLYRGILANRDNKPEESIKLLQPLLDKIKSDEHPPEEKMLRKALAEDYLRTGDWTAANQAYLELDYRLGGSMTPEERNEIELPVKLLPLAIHNPPMTVESAGPFTLPYDRDFLGLADVPVFVDAESHDWMMDPTAPFNLICRSTAKSVGLKISEASATVHTITGRPIQVHMTVIPRFTIGTVTLRNVTAFVFDDADYYFPQSQYWVRGVLGYPAVSALGSVTVVTQTRIEVRPGDSEQRLKTGARFYLDGDRVVAALGKPGEERMYAVDAGGQQTYLTSRYYAEHSGDFDGKQIQLMAMPGTQKKPPAPAYVADAVTLSIGDRPVTLHYLQVLTQPLNAAAIDDTYGTLGIDVLDEFQSYTFDYKTMRFGIKNE